jgi:PAS domain S-box-containing protein
VNGNEDRNRRILVIDDNEEIHRDFRAILGSTNGDGVSVDEEESAIFGTSTSLGKRQEFEIDSAFQGQEGLEKVRAALKEDRPYAMGFVDVRMPPGWDGIETIQRIWQEYPELQVVICTAYSDFSWDQIVSKLGRTEQLLILKKPFDNVEVYQFASALTEKWHLGKQAKLKQEELERLVTERTTKLQETKERYHSIFTNVGDALCIADRDGTILEANPQMCKMSGYSYEELIGSSAKRLVHPDALHIFKRFLEDVGRGKTFRTETMDTHKSGAVINIEAVGTPINIGGRKCLLAVLRDITERRRAEDKLRENEKRYRSIFTHVGDGLCILGPDGTMLEANPQMCKMHGYSYEELVGSDTKRLVHPDSLYLFKQFVEDVQRGRTFHAEAMDIHKSGAVINIDVTGSLIMFSGRECLLGVIRDITERKKAEEELKKQDQLKSDFVVNVSHELRTPLAIFRNIISNIRAGVMGKINRKQNESLQITEKQIGRLARIISDFLDISKIESGKMSLNPERLAIQTAVTDTVKLLQCLAAKKNIKMKTLMPENELFVKADYDRVTQVLTNLIDNAVKFTPDCGGKITVRVKDLGNEVRVDVEDNGRSIESDDISEVFNRFVQVGKHVGPGSHGTGLGLAICKEVIELQGGRIWAENIPTGGANFCFVLPKCDFVPAGQSDTADGPPQPATALTE